MSAAKNRGGTLGNDRLVGEGGSLSAFPFCPALAQQRTGDPLEIEPGHRELAEAKALAETVRIMEAEKKVEKCS